MTRAGPEPASPGAEIPELASLSALLRGADPPGVYRLARTSGTGASEPVRELALAGWRAVEVGATGSLGGLYEQLQRALPFPSHFGANLDALFDVLCEIDRPTALVWYGWSGLAQHDPGGWRRLVRVLGIRSAETSLAPFAVLLHAGRDCDPA